MQYDLNLDNDPEFGALEAMVRITGSDGEVVWQGPTRDLHALLANRWAAFTDDELAILDDALHDVAVGSDTPADDLAEDLEAEIMRRPSLRGRRA